MSMDKDKCAKECNTLLQGEISAVETYQQALSKVDGDPKASTLQSIAQDHERHVEKLREHIRSMGAEPATSSGAWGSFAKAVEGTGKVFGNSGAINALIQGEEHGKNHYEQALEKDYLTPESRTMIQQTLLPHQKQHITTLRTLLS